MTERPAAWNEIRTELCRKEPTLYELEPGGALGLTLDDDDWILELTPDGRLICQTGMDMEDIQTLLSDGTPEELGTDELAKQAKYYIQPAVSKHREALLKAGFQEASEMTDQFVAATFHRDVDFRKLDEVLAQVQWCKQQFKKS